MICLIQPTILGNGLFKCVNTLKTIHASDYCFYRRAVLSVVWKTYTTYVNIYSTYIIKAIVACEHSTQKLKVY